MEPSPLTRDDRLGDSLLSENVSERELVAWRFGQHSFVAQLLQRRQQAWLFERREASELHERRRAAEDGGGVDNGASVVRQTQQRPPGRFGHRTRQIERVGGRIQLSRVEQLADQERVPSGALVHIEREARRRQSDRAAQEIADLGDAEWGELEVLVSTVRRRSEKNWSR